MSPKIHFDRLIMDRLLVFFAQESKVSSRRLCRRCVCSRLIGVRDGDLYVSRHRIAFWRAERSSLCDRLKNGFFADKEFIALRSFPHRHRSLGQIKAFLSPCWIGLTGMSSLTTSSSANQNNNNNKAQVRSQRRLLFEGFNMPESLSSSSRRGASSTSMMTSTPEPKLHDDEHLK